MDKTLIDSLTPKMRHPTEEEELAMELILKDLLSNGNDLNIKTITMEEYYETFRNK